MVFKQLWNWIDAYFSKDENRQIKEQAKIIDEMSEAIIRLEKQLGETERIINELNDNNANLRNENRRLENEVKTNKTKAAKFDVIAEYVEPEILEEILKQHIELE